MGLHRHTRVLRTMVLVHTLFSTSHVRTVESNPQLYALAPVASRPNTTRDTRAMWLLRTATGALRVGRAASPSSAILRRFLRSPFVTSSNGTSSVAGIVASQSPMRPSQDEVSRCAPAGLATMEDRGAVCRCREASVCAFGASRVEKSIRVRRAVRSWAALAIR